LSYEITQCYLPLNTSEHTRDPALTPARQAGTRFLPNPEGWKAELT